MGFRVTGGSYVTSGSGGMPGSGEATSFADIGSVESSVTPGSGQLRFDWDPTGESPSPLAYQCFWSQPGGTQLVDDSDEVGFPLTTYTETGLTAGTYQVGFRVLNEAGWSDTEELSGIVVT